MSDETIGVLLVIFGFLGIAGGILGKDFHAADVITLSEFKQKVPTWSGRLVFLLVGLGLIALGIKMIVAS